MAGVHKVNKGQVDPLPLAGSVSLQSKGLLNRALAIVKSSLWNGESSELAAAVSFILTAVVFFAGFQGGLGVINSQATLIGFETALGTAAVAAGAFSVYKSNKDKSVFDNSFRNLVRRMYPKPNFVGIYDTVLENTKLELGRGIALASDSKPVNEVNMFLSQLKDYTIKHADIDAVEVHDLAIVISNRFFALNPKYREDKEVCSMLEAHCVSLQAHQEDRIQKVESPQEEGVFNGVLRDEIKDMGPEVLGIYSAVLAHTRKLVEPRLKDMANLDRLTRAKIEVREFMTQLNKYQNIDATTVRNIKDAVDRRRCIVGAEFALLEERSFI